MAPPTCPKCDSTFFAQGHIEFMGRNRHNVIHCFKCGAIVSVDDPRITMIRNDLEEMGKLLKRLQR